MRAERRTRIIALILAVLFTFMQLAGWQISMRYGTTVHQHVFFQKIGMLNGFWLVFAAVFETAFWYAVIDFSFYFLRGRKKRNAAKTQEQGMADHGDGAVLLSVFRTFGMLAGNLFL